VRDKFEAGTLTESEIHSLGWERQQEYLSRELQKKYGRPVGFSCSYCAVTALFKNPGEGYVTDEEIIEATGFEHM